MCIYKYKFVYMKVMYICKYVYKHKYVPMLDATAKGMDMNDKEHVSFRHSAKVVILQEAE